MKLTISIVFFTLVVVLQQMEAPTAQDIVINPIDFPPFCPNIPVCLVGTELNTKTCRCDGNIESICPFGFTKIVKPNEMCACEKKTKPTCLSGFTLNNACTLCSISSTPSCPSGRTLSPSTASCTQTVEPICPPGHIQQGCECVRRSGRQCSLGTLSLNGCKCTTSTPLCLGGFGCTLNTEECSCTGAPVLVQCFVGSFCDGLTGPSTTTVQECCESPFGIQKSYRTGSICSTCPLR